MHKASRPGRVEGGIDVGSGRVNAPKWLRSSLAEGGSPAEGRQRADASKVSRRRVVRIGTAGGEAVSAHLRFPRMSANVGDRQPFLAPRIAL